MTADPRMRFRVWVAARLVDETWVDSSNPEYLQLTDAVRARHMAIVEQAIGFGDPWLIEVYDPEQPEGEAYLRIGDDADGMVDPRPLS